MSLDIKGKSTDHFFDLPQNARHTADTTQLATSNLPQLDWDQLSTPSAPQLQAAVPSAPQAGQQNDPFAYAAPAPPPPPPASDDPFAASPIVGNAFPGSNAAPAGYGAMDLLTGASSHAQASQQQSAPTPVSRSNSFRRPVASQATLNRHAIMPQQQTRQQPTSRPSQQSLYPQFDKEPLAPIDYGIAEPFAPALSNQMASLQLQQQQQQPNLMDAPAASMPSPQLEMQLGPQQMQVHTVVMVILLKVATLLADVGSAAPHQNNAVAATTLCITKLLACVLVRDLHHVLSLCMHTTL